MWAENKKKKSPKRDPWGMPLVIGRAVETLHVVSHVGIFWRNKIGKIPAIDRLLQR